MLRIFLSYRREDSQDVTGRLADRLAAHFGAASVFLDVDAVPVGVDFREHLSQWVAGCDIVLAVIGQSWLSAAHTVGPRQGMRRLDDPQDLVRIEIEAALERGIPVVPVLVGGAAMPSAEQLPGSLGPLAYRQAAEVRPGRDFHANVDRLVHDIERAIAHETIGVARVVAGPAAAPVPVPRPRAPTIRSLLGRGAVVPEPITVRIGRILLEAVEQARAEGRAIPNVSPSRVDLGDPFSEPEPTLLEGDVGGALEGHEDSPLHGAPEDPSGLQPTTAAAVYTVGQVMWELLNGRPAFSGDREVVRRLKQRQPVGLRFAQPPLPVSRELMWLVTRATAARPDQRPSAAEALAALRSMETETPAPLVLTPVNLGFEGAVAGGTPAGWFDSLGYVDGVSLAYDFSVQRAEPGPGYCARILRPPSRRSTTRRGAPADEFGSIMQRFPAPHVAGCRVRLEADLRTEDTKEGVGIWIRADAGSLELTPGARNRGHRTLFFDNMSDRWITGTTDWTRHAIEADLPEGVEWLNIGVLVQGSGAVWVDDVALWVRSSTGPWLPLGWEHVQAGRDRLETLLARAAFHLRGDP